MAAIVLIDYFTDSIFSSMGTLGLVVGALGITVFLTFIYATNMKTSHSLLISAIPFLFDGITALFNISWGIGLFILLGGLLLANGIRKMLLSK